MTFVLSKRKYFVIDIGKMSMYDAIITLREVKDIIELGYVIKRTKFQKFLLFLKGIIL